MSEFIVRVLDLLEAEGRAARRAIYRLFAALLLLVGAAALMLAAIAFIITALVMLLAQWVTWPGAFAILGGVLLITAFIGAAIAHHLREKKASVR